MMELRCYDNGGVSFDRYTILPHCRARAWYDQRRRLWTGIASSDNPFHPQGFGQHTEAVAGPHLGKRVALDSLPEDVQRFARYAFAVR